MPAKKKKWWISSGKLEIEQRENEKYAQQPKEQKGKGMIKMNFNEKPEVNG